MLFDGEAEHTMRHDEYPDVTVTELWHQHDGAAVALDTAGERLGRRPGPGESRFYSVEIAPGAYVPPHATPTVDYHCVVGGEITCLLEHGTVTVAAGDVLVLQGDEHGWINRGAEPFRSVAVMVNTEEE